MEIRNLRSLVTVTLTLWFYPVTSLSGKVLLVSFDGFRWDYLDIVPGLVNFPKFASEGSYADYMNNTFTTLTFSTHYSMATGLYQESHGLVSNYMYDPVFNEDFYPGCPTGNDQKWWGGEPIWITATLQGKKAGCMFWAGTEVAFNDVKPAILLPYDNSVSFEVRVDTVLDWFQYDDIDLGLVYFDQPDKAGHKYGPRSSEVAEQVQIIDGIVGYLMDGIESRDLNYLNVIIVSDHGVANMSIDRMVVIPEHVDWNLVRHFTEVGAICHVFCEPGKRDEVYESLAEVHPSMSVYKREEIPEHWHYSHNRRIGDVLLVMDEGWSCTEDITFTWNNAKGTHGYDNRLLSMKPIFMARGPDIKRDFKIKPFMSLDIYPLTATLLGIEQSPNNGTLRIVEDMIRSEPKSKAVIDSQSSTTSVMLSLQTVLVSLSLWKWFI